MAGAHLSSDPSGSEMQDERCEDSRPCLLHGRGDGKMMDLASDREAAARPRGLPSPRVEGTHPVEFSSHPHLTPAFLGRANCPWLQLWTHCWEGPSACTSGKSRTTTPPPAKPCSSGRPDLGFTVGPGLPAADTTDQETPPGGK